MQSSTMFNTIANKIQFHGIKSVYPFGERVQCFFTIPEVCQPQSGDWIGIFPVGWSSLVRDCIVRQNIRVEEFTGPYGQIEFEPIQYQQVPMHSTYQFVYVTNSGEYMVLGSSTPFRFIQNNCESTPFFGGKFLQPETSTWMPTEPIYQRPLFVVESEMQKLQNEIVGLEQGWKWTNQTQVQVGNTWQPRLVKIEQILKEKVKIEQAQRKLEQFSMLAQLKSCERHIVIVTKREPEIKEFLLRAKIQTKVACFEQKIQQIFKTRGVDMGIPVEHYVRKYEQLLKEKVVLDIEKRRGLFQKLRQTIRDCERKLRELQTIDQEHFINFNTLLKNKLVQFESRIGGLEMNINQHFETLMGSFVLEQEKTGMNLYQAQRELGYLINEIVTKVQEMEITECGCYASLRIPKIVTGLMFQTHPKLVQIVQLEKKINEQKMKLRMKMLNNGVWNTVSGGLTGVNGTGAFGGINGNWFPTTPCGPVQIPKYAVEQITRGVWFSPIIEKLKQIQLHLTKPWTGMYQTSPISHSRFWFDKKSTQIGQLIQSLIQYQSELNTPFPLTQSRFRNVLVKLQELREQYCVEIPRFIHETIVPTTFGGVLPISHPFYTVVESCQLLNTIIAEKINEINQWFQYQPMTYSPKQETPFEWMFATLGAPHSNTMLELIDIEKKLVEMKGLTLASIHYMHLEERLVELEQYVRSVELFSGKREKCIERIRGLKTILDENVEFQPTFVTIPEQFIQHQTRFEKMCQLVSELECHLIEEISMTGFSVSPINFGGEFMPTIGGSRYNLNYIHMKFLKLVNEFQMQFPECFAPKIEEIVSFLRTAVVIKPTGQVFFGNELREKLAEFETILCQPECEISCLTTSIFPQSTMTTTKTQRECLKFLIRQVRELKSHLLVVLGGNWTTEFPTTEQTLVDLMNKRMWIEGARVPHSTTRVIETTGPSTIVKSVTVPVGNLLKPVSIERLVSETEGEWIGLNKQSVLPRGVKFSSFELVDDECDQEDDEEWDEEEDFETGVASSILNKPQFVKIDTNGNEECIYQIEKHIRKCLGGEDKWIVDNLCQWGNVSEQSGIVTRRF